MDFIKLFNEIVKLAKPTIGKDSFVSSMDDRFEDIDLDSLDHLMMMMYFGSIYEIEEEVLQNSKYKTVKELQDFLEANKTRDVESIEQAMEYAK
jgi:acyl carrier protein